MKRISWFQKMFGITVCHYFAEDGGDGGGAAGVSGGGEAKDGEDKSNEGKDGQDKDGGSKNGEDKSGEGKGDELKDFNLPDDMKSTPELQAKFKEAAKTLGLSQEAAQKYVDYEIKLAKEYTTAQQDERKKLLDTWRSETDQYLGADKDKKLAVIARGINASPTGAQVKEILQKSGLENNPHIVKFLYFVGEQFTEDGGISKGGNAAAAEESEDPAVEHARKQLEGLKGNK
ncbi:MAG: hypothetical protein LBL00_07820 [Endomicrobium sp.]|jgi:hypothetical protein|nr:hypothetical protein [Endomicrobium sp.]